MLNNAQILIYTMILISHYLQYITLINYQQMKKREAERAMIRFKFIEEEDNIKNQSTTEQMGSMSIRKKFDQATAQNPFVIFNALKLNKKTNKILFQAYDIQDGSFIKRVASSMKKRKNNHQNNKQNNNQNKLQSKQIEQRKKGIRKYILQQIQQYLPTKNKNRKGFKSSLALVSQFLENQKHLQELDQHLFEGDKICYKFLNQWFDVQNKRNKFEIKQIQDRGIFFLIQLKKLSIICTIGLKILKIRDQLKKEQHFINKIKNDQITYDQIPIQSPQFPQKFKQFIQILKLILKQPNNQMIYLRQSLSHLIQLVLIIIAQRHQKLQKLTEKTIKNHEQEGLKPQMILKQALDDIYKYVTGQQDIGIYIQNKKDISYHN